jgi:N-acetylglucosamine kinase-like BadF-type ATPase
MNYLGIDGGGSKTTFLLVDSHDQEIHRDHSGPSNWLSVGQAAAARALRDGLSALPSSPDVICGGFAGGARHEAQAFYKQTLASVFPDANILVESDAFVSYVGAIGLQPGVLLIAGTGSIAIGRREDGSMIRVGGWGPHFGDEGSGFWMGREAVRAALHELDSKAHSGFADRIALTLGFAHITEVVPAWASGQIDVPKIADLFRELVRMYPGEPANRILKEAASHLKSMAETAVERVGVEHCTKALSGSVALHPAMRLLIGSSFEEPQHPPEKGAIIWAKRVLAGK